jgi:thioredoxin 1
MELNESQDFDAEIAEGVVLVDFHAQWCGPCRQLGPVLEQLTDVKIVKVDVDQHQQLAVKYGVTSIPAMIFFKDGENKHAVLGVQPKHILQSKIDELQ